MNNTKYFYPYKKKVSALVVYDPVNYKIMSLQFHTVSRERINMTMPFDQYTPHASLQEVIETIVKRALQNNMDIPHYTAFNVEWYDIDFISTHGEDISQYAYLHGAIKLKG